MKVLKLYTYKVIIKGKTYNMDKPVIMSPDFKSRYTMAVIGGVQMMGEEESITSDVVPISYDVIDVDYIILPQVDIDRLVKKEAHDRHFELTSDRRKAIKLELKKLGVVASETASLIALHRQLVERQAFYSKLKVTGKELGIKLSRTNRYGELRIHRLEEAIRQHHNKVVVVKTRKSPYGGYGLGQPTVTKAKRRYRANR